MASRTVFDLLYDQVTAQSSEIDTLTYKLAEAEEELKKYKRLVKGMHMLDEKRCKDLKDLRTQLDDKTAGN